MFSSHIGRVTTRRSKARICGERERGRPPWLLSASLSCVLGMQPPIGQWMLPVCVDLNGWRWSGCASLLGCVSVTRVVDNRRVWTMDNWTMLDIEYCPLGVNFWRGQWTFGYCSIIWTKLG